MVDRIEGAAAAEIDEAEEDGSEERQRRGKTIRVFVEVEPRQRPVRLEFETNQVTGRTIKERAGVPLENDLARRQGQRLELVTNEETITIANGDRFVSLPPGTIS
jgi:hypothetical protein